MPLVEARGLTRFYDGRPAVVDLSFALHRGEVMAFLGPNGAGKTTTMQMLCGILAPTSGEIEIDGIDLLEEPKMAKCHIGYLPEIPPLYRELTVLEFLRFCGELHQLEGKRLAEAVGQAIERCGLGSVRDHRIATLSKGYQQRVGIAQAILHDPKVIVLDEPTVGLDPRQIEEIRQLIAELGRDHAILLSTHLLSEAQRLCNRILILHRGRKVADLTAKELERLLRERRLLLVTRRPANLKRLTAIEGVERVDREGENRYLLDVSPEAEGIEDQIALSVLEAGWGLRELSPQRRSLEELFLQLTGDEGTP